MEQKPIHLAAATNWSDSKDDLALPAKHAVGCLAIETWSVTLHRITGRLKKVIRECSCYDLKKRLHIQERGNSRIHIECLRVQVVGSHQTTDHADVGFECIHSYPPAI